MTSIEEIERDVKDIKAAILSAAMIIETLGVQMQDIGNKMRLVFEEKEGAIYAYEVGGAKWQ